MFALAIGATVLIGSSAGGAAYLFGLSFLSDELMSDDATADPSSRASSRPPNPVRARSVNAGVPWVGFEPTTAFGYP
jgi:hypothetical protein